MIKKEIRVLGIACSPPTPRRHERVEVVGVVYRGGLWLEGVMRTGFSANAIDVSRRISRMITRSPHHPQLRLITLVSPLLGRYNVINLSELHHWTGLPVLVVTKRKLNQARMARSIRSLPKPRPRMRALRSLGSPVRVTVGPARKPVYVYSKGLDEADVEEILRVSCGDGELPEAVRVARLIVSALCRSRHFPSLESLNP